MKFNKLLLPFLASVALSLPVRDKDGRYYVKRGDKQFYIPNELRNNNFENNASNWSFARSKASQDFILFWEPGFGENPAAAGNLRFDANDILDKAEKFFDYYKNTLKFIEGKSQTDTYKMSIWIKYQNEWLATGSGYDNVVGALWVNPSTVQPVGGTIAHEIGHTFQYQVHCDGKYGFRDQDYVGTYWEVCAQWMASRLYPEMFSNTEFELIPNNCWKHPLHENFRYQSILFNELWSEKHGIDIIGKIWNGAANLDDPFDAYKRVTKIDQAALNDEMFLVAQKNILFDYKHMGNVLKPFRNRYNIKLRNNNDGTYQIPPEQCTQSYGYAPIPLEIPANGKVTVQFTGITGDRAYHNHQDKVAGWRYGFVAVTGNGDTAEYSAPSIGTTKTSSATFQVPNGTKDLWFIAMGAPTEHVRHHWKEGDNSGDEHFPWKAAFSTCIRGQRCTPSIPVDENAAVPVAKPNANPEPVPAPANPEPAPANPAPAPSNGEIVDEVPAPFDEVPGSVDAPAPAAPVAPVDAPVPADPFANGQFAPFGNPNAFANGQFAPFGNPDAFANGQFAPFGNPDAFANGQFAPFGQFAPVDNAVAPQQGNYDFGANFNFGTSPKGFDLNSLLQKVDLSKLKNFFQLFNRN